MQTQPTSTPTPKKVNKLLTLFILFIGILLGISLVRNITTITLADKKIQVTKEKLEKIKSENEKLSSELKAMDLPEYKEKQARDQLGYSKEGDLVLVLPEKDIIKKLSPITAENEENTTFEPNWKRWMKLFF